MCVCGKKEYAMVKMQLKKGLNRSEMRLGTTLVQQRIGALAGHATVLNTGRLC
jgi:hypothetical protein